MGIKALIEQLKHFQACYGAVEVFAFEATDEVRSTLTDFVTMDVEATELIPTCPHVTKLGRKAGKVAVFINLKKI